VIADTRELVEKLAESATATPEALAALLACDDSAAKDLFAAADQVRARTVGDDVHLRGLIEFSNHCRRNCLYCGLRRENRSLSRYRMVPDEIVACAIAAADLGYRTVVLQSGEDMWYAAPILADVVGAIKAARDIAVTLSIGERSEGEYRLLTAAGADRFLLRMEVSSPIRYARFHPDSDWEERQKCLRAARTARFQVGSGTLIGLPGHGVGTLSEDLLYLQSLELDMIGVGPFIPHPATPLAGARGGTLGVALRFLACLRLLCPRALIPATTALAALDPSGWEQGLRAGADVLMPNVTPLKYRDQYDLYPGKVWSRSEAAAFRREVVEMVERLGRQVSDGPGHTRLWRDPVGLGSRAAEGTVRS